MQSGAVEDGLPNVTAARTPRIQAYFDEATNSVSYLVADPATGEAAIIDPVLGFDVASGKIDNEAAGRILADTDAAGLRILWMLETHVHADHLSAAQSCPGADGREARAGAGILQVQSVFGPKFGADDLKPNGGDFDRLLEDGDKLPLGELEIEVDRDTRPYAGLRQLPDRRCGIRRRHIVHAGLRHRALRFPRRRRAPALPVDAADPVATARYAAVHVSRLQGAGPRGVRVGDDGRRATREERPYRRRSSEEDYVSMRKTRDATLKVPRLLYPAIQVNIRGGRLPPAGREWRRYIKLPLSVA